MKMCQPVQEIEDAEKGYNGDDDIKRHWRLLVLYALRMEPSVGDVLQFAALLQA